MLYHVLAVGIQLFFSGTIDSYLSITTKSKHTQANQRWNIVCRVYVPTIEVCLRVHRINTYTTSLVKGYAMYTPLTAYNNSCQSLRFVPADNISHDMGYALYTPLRYAYIQFVQVYTDQLVHKLGLVHTALACTSVWYIHMLLLPTLYIFTKIPSTTTTNWHYVR